MGFLEERIKQAGKNRPVFRKPEPPVSVNNMSGNAEPPAAPRAGVRGGNRVIPAPASEFNPLRGSAAGGGSGGGSDATVPGDVNSLLQRSDNTVYGQSTALVLFLNFTTQSHSMNGDLLCLML